MKFWNIIGWIAFCWFLAITAFLLLCSCEGNYANDFEDAGVDAAPLPQYPDTRQGYKPRVRDIEGLLVIDETSNTLPDIQLPCVGSLGATCGASTNLWSPYQPTETLGLIVWSIMDCPPCDNLYKWLDEQYEYQILVVIGGADKKYTETLIPDLTYLYDTDFSYSKKWAGDSWPEAPRVWPTTQVVDLNTMEILAEIIGFKPDSDFESRLNNLVKFAKENQSD